MEKKQSGSSRSSLEGTKVRKAVRRIQDSDKTIIKPKIKDPGKADVPEINEKNEEKPKKRAKKKYGNSSLSAAMKTVTYIGVVLIASVLLAVFLILAANEVFAFDKADNEMTVTLVDYPSIDDVADLLYDNGIIKFPNLFRLYATVKKKNDYPFAGGVYTINNTMSYDSLISSFIPAKPEREQVSITIPEGYNVDEIIDLFLANGIGTRDGFIDVINKGEFDYWFLEDIEYDENRYYTLEGYLYPDTYYFWSDSSEYTAIKKLLDNFKVKVRKSWVNRATELGMTFDEVLTLASMIQEEARYTVDYFTVSSVFHNRLNSEEFDGLLQSDACIQYFYRHTYGEKKAPFTDEDRKADTPYNTYLYKGLTPGPLSTPTVDAINAALYPAETGYYYFVSDNDGYCIFSSDFEEHKANVEAVEKGKKALDEKELDA